MRYYFPDRKRVNDSHTHKLRELIRLSELEEDRMAEVNRYTNFRDNWEIARRWSEESRYERHDRRSAAALIAAIGHRKYGVMTVKTALVATEWELGKMLAALDDADSSISVAMWLYPQEYEDWRFVRAARSLDEAGPFGASRLLHNTLEAAGIPDALMVLRMNDPFIKGLRRMFAKNKALECQRQDLYTIGGRYVEDGLVYRIR
jgi:hypothetical protein